MKRPWISVVVWLCCEMCCLAPRVHAQDTPDTVNTPNSTDTRVSFERDVRPLLTEHCQRCHGAEQRESGYRVDVQSVALRGGDSEQAAIVPGHADQSRLVKVLKGTDEDGLQMPPAGEGMPLEPAQIELLARWIEQGADWPAALAGDANARPTSEHWSLQPLRPVRVPALRDPWIRSPIDAFVLARLRAAGLAPSATASLVQRARRLHLDLLGLPPSPALITQLQRTSDPAAYEQLVDQCLADFAHGERWARHWLDVIRFGESDGFETNPERQRAYPFRDYVINAFNDDTPYNQFVQEQIAGDRLGSDVATGFLVAGPYDRVKSPDINLTLMQRQDELADIVNTTGTAFLGVTVGCARCHNHKFDPITQEDYYALQAVFAGVNHGERALRTADSQAALDTLARLRTELAETDRQLRDLEPLALPESAAGEGQLREPVTARGNVERFPLVKARWIRMIIQSTSGGGEPCIDELEVFGASSESEEQGKLATATEDAATRIAAAAELSAHDNLALASRGGVVTASGTLAGYAIHQLSHLNDGQYGNGHSWIADTASAAWVQIELPEVATIDRIEWARDRDGQFADRVITQYAFQVATEPDQWRPLVSSQDRSAYPRANADPYAFVARLPAQAAEQAKRFLTRQAELRQQMQSLEAQSVPTAYVGTFAQPGPTFRLYRGDPLAPREQVLPNALRVIGDLEVSVNESESERRLALAKWITDRNNPLTARVIVNRLWQHHFGTGLVATTSDFGANGVPPTHPELLDWLANELIAHDWSLKWIHRQILLSSTYQQSCTPRSECLAVDAGSRLLWRFPPRRLESEAIRDCILAAAGTLNRQANGRGFLAFDVQAETVHHYFAKTKWGPSEWRRMIYMTKIRQEQDSVFGLFDCPDGGQVMPTRSRSTTPLQALNLLNSEFVLQQADLMAGELSMEAGGLSTDGKPNEHLDRFVQLAFMRAFSRTADASELKWSRELIVNFGSAAFCRAILNSNEFLFLN